MVINEQDHTDSLSALIANAEVLKKQERIPEGKKNL